MRCWCLVTARWRWTQDEFHPASTCLWLSGMIGATVADQKCHFVAGKITSTIKHSFASGIFWCAHHFNLPRLFSKPKNGRSIIMINTNKTKTPFWQAKSIKIVQIYPSSLHCVGETWSGESRCQIEGQRRQGWQGQGSLDSLVIFWHGCVWKWIPPMRNSWKFILMITKHWTIQDHLRVPYVQTDPYNSHVYFSPQCMATQNPVVDHHIFDELVLNTISGQNHIFYWMVKSCWFFSPVTSDWWKYVCWIWLAIVWGHRRFKLPHESRGVQPMR